MTEILTGEQHRALEHVKRATDALLEARSNQLETIRHARALGVPLRAIATEALLSHEQVRRTAPKRPSP